LVQNRTRLCLHFLFPLIIFDITVARIENDIICYYNDDDDDDDDCRWWLSMMIVDVDVRWLTIDDWRLTLDVRRLTIDNGVYSSSSSLSHTIIILIQHTLLTCFGLFCLFYHTNCLLCTTIFLLSSLTHLIHSFSSSSTLYYITCMLINRIGAIRFLGPTRSKIKT